MTRPKFSPDELLVLPRAVIAAHRAELEEFYRNADAPQTGVRREGAAREEVFPLTHGQYQERVYRLLRAAIYPTTRAPDYVVDQLGYGELVPERRGGVVEEQRGKECIRKFEFGNRRTRRTRSGSAEVAEGPDQSGLIAQAETEPPVLKLSGEGR